MAIAPGLSGSPALQPHNTHTHLTAFFPGLPGSAGTRKVKPIWILLKQKTVSGSGISWDICKSDNHASTQQLSFFTGRMPFLPPNQQRQSTEGTLQPHGAATELQLQLEVDGKSVGECLRPDARTGGRTTRKHNASGPIYWTGEGIECAVVLACRSTKNIIISAGLTMWQMWQMPRASVLRGPSAVEKNFSARQ